MKMDWRKNTNVKQSKIRMAPSLFDPDVGVVLTMSVSNEDPLDPFCRIQRKNQYVFIKPQFRIQLYFRDLKIDTHIYMYMFAYKIMLITLTILNKFITFVAIN